MSNERKLTAKCDCGELSIRVAGRSMTQLVCHCGDCRDVTGQPFTEAVFFAPGKFEVRGQATPLTMKGGSGHAKTYFSCPQCGAMLYATVDALGGAAGVIASRLSPFRFRPQMHVWTSQKSSGTKITGLVPRFSKGPPPAMVNGLLWLLRTVGVLPR